MPDGVPMAFVRALGSRIQWECPDCGHRTTTAKNVLAYCTACTEAEDD